MKTYYRCISTGDEDDAFWSRFFDVDKIYVYKRHDNDWNLVLKENKNNCYHSVPIECFELIKPLAYYNGSPIFITDVDKFLDWYLLYDEEQKVTMYNESIYLILKR
jgi:hypothetical protein